jgi:hypothetical protein
MTGPGLAGIFFKSGCSMGENYFGQTISHADEVLALPGSISFSCQSCKRNSQKNSTKSLELKTAGIKFPFKFSYEGLTSLVKE